MPARRMRCNACGQACDNYSKEMLNALATERVCLDCEEEYFQQQQVGGEDGEQYHYEGENVDPEQDSHQVHEALDTAAAVAHAQEDAANAPHYTEENEPGWMQSNQASEILHTDQALAAEAQDYNNHRHYDEETKPGWMHSDGTGEALDTAKAIAHAQLDAENAPHYTEENEPGWMDSHQVEEKMYDQQQY